MESPFQLTLELVLVLGTSIMLVLSLAIILFVFLYQRKLINRKIAYQQVEELLKQQELKSAYAQLAGQDEERQRIAVEMHDNLGSTMVTLTMYANTLLKANLSDKEREVAEKLHQIAQKAHLDARQIAHKLDTSILGHFGLKASITDLAQSITDSGKVNVSTNIDLEERLDGEISKNLYRITQELLNNSLKHAQATTIQIDITQVEQEYISYIYEDNGKGLPENFEKSKGMGMRNIFARIEKMNGSYTLDKKDLKGFTIIIELPIK